MNLLEYLKRILESRKTEAEEIETRIKTSADVEEVRKLGDTLKKLSDEIRETEEQLREIEKEDKKNSDSKGETDDNNEPKGDSRGVNPMKGYSKGGKDDSKEARTSLGDHFVKHAKDALEKRGQRFSISAPEFRAATDAHATGGVEGAFKHLLVDVDPNIVQAYRRPTISDLFNWGVMTKAAIQYFIEGGRDGDFETVAEGALKPQIHYHDPTPVIDSLKKIAAFIKIHDEMFDDLPYIVSEINGRLLYDLSIQEEFQLLKGDGTGTNVLGLYNRSGLQTITSPSTAENIDTIFKTKRMIANATGLLADGLLINPADYEVFRLSKDSNGQYFGGGFFAGQYGQGGIIEEPPIWGIRTVVTPMIDEGTVLVGSFTQGATPYRKGGVRVESTNSNEDDFIHNMVTVRCEERIALAVRRPAAFVKVSFA